MCTFPPITMPMSGDGCCPAGANANNDSDCAPVCGNMIVEVNEQCDDGNLNNNDACNNMCRLNTVTAAFKFTDLDLRDPHVYVNFIGCRDVTDTQLVGFSVNNELQTNIQTDGDNNGLLDLAPTLVFRNFTQAAAATQPVELHFANCTAPQGSTSCTPSGGTVVMATATNMSAAQCLTFLPGTVRPYVPAITSTGSPCFVTTAATVTLDLGGIPITLRDARIAATYVGNPASSTNNGLLMGFISETDANNTMIPNSFPLVGGMPLSALLPGGSNNCAAHNDKDVNNGVMGWWFYLNFPAARVPWSG
jgi:cysteine-rich repeat protein